MSQILYLGQHRDALTRLQDYLAVPNAQLQYAAPDDFASISKTLREYELLLIAEDVEAPIRLAQEAYTQDKHLSILLLAEAGSHAKLKQALQFSPFIGPTVQSVSTAIGPRLAPIVVDALQRTAQRRSFAKLKTFALATPQFEPQVVAKVRADFSTKVLEEAPLGAVLISGTGTVTSANQYAIGLVGRPEKEVLSMPLKSLFPETVREEIHQFVLDGYLSAPKRVFAVQWPGGTKHLELSVTPLDTPLALEYKLLIITDITAVVLAQRQTQADLKELGQLNADLDNFIYTASHDLKAPISNIEGLLTVLRHELAQPTGLAEIPTLLDLMQDSVERFKRTIEHLTDLTKLQKAHSQPATTVDLAEVVEDVRRDLLPHLQATGGHLQVEVAPGTTLAFSHKNLRSIVYNLLSNALKYRHPDRAPLVQLRCYLTHEHQVLEVQDNGLGLTKEQQNKAFGLFQRLHNHVEGSGVGLYMVQKIIDNAGGRIEVESQVGHGSTFRIYFSG